MEISKISTMVRNVQGWYEKSVVRTVRKIQGWYEKSMVRNVYGTNSLWYEKSGNRFYLQQSGVASGVATSVFGGGQEFRKS